MKKSLLVALGAIFTIALTGCVRMDLNVEVNKDGTGTYSGSVAYNASYFSEDQIKDSDNDTPIKHYEYDGQDWIGYDLDGKEYDSYEELAEALTQIEGSGTSGSGSGVFKTVTIDSKSGAFGSTYTFDAETLPVSGDSSSSMGSMSEYVKFNINIKMPGKVSEGSLEGATLNDDGTVSITYNADTAAKVHIESSEGGSLGIILIIAGILVVVAIVVVVIVVVMKKKPAAPVAPVAPSYTPSYTPVDPQPVDNQFTPAAPPAAEPVNVEPITADPISTNDPQQ